MILRKIDHCYRLLFIGCLLLGPATLDFAQNRNLTMPDTTSDSGLGGGNSIEGRVIMPSGQRLERRVKVKLATMTRGDITSMTDETGRFAFRGLPGGDYTVIIDGEQEFEPATYPVNILQFRGSPPQSYMVQIRLEVRKGTDLRPGVVSSELASAPPRARDFYTKAEELAKTGDRQGAIEQLKLAIAEYPNFMIALNELGVQYLKLNEPAKADESFQAALKIQPEAFSPLLNRGIVLILLNRFDDAEASLRRALKANQQSANAHFYLGRAIGSQSQARFDEAEKEFTSSVKLGGDDMKEAHRMLAIIYSSRGDKKRAASELETYLRLAPNTPDAEQLQKVIQQLRGTEPQGPASAQKVKPSP